MKSSTAIEGLGIETGDNEIADQLLRFHAFGKALKEQIKHRTVSFGPRSVDCSYYDSTLETASRRPPQHPPELIFESIRTLLLWRGRREAERRGFCCGTEERFYWVTSG
eukprot:TRINITY_DN6269_c0_g1_i1.p2 TRINITY_DN6269_c0_g1~~TRINITY_DN6269_c0_g1_i1.p2  ORF type:complete len:109 (+),score=3.06 TRINITY_DN6269_c0_g1_i1:638-964(+)